MKTFKVIPKTIAFSTLCTTGQPLASRVFFMEHWKIIPNTNGLYQASNLGRIKRTDTNKLIKQNIGTSGYLSFQTSINNVQKRIQSHRAIMYAFYGLSDLTVNHKDGKK